VSWLRSLTSHTRDIADRRGTTLAGFRRGGFFFIPTKRFLKHSICFFDGGIRCICRRKGFLPGDIRYTCRFKSCLPLVVGVNAGTDGYGRNYGQEDRESLEAPATSLAAPAVGASRPRSLPALVTCCSTISLCLASNATWAL
jgi:hypothetical protein